MNTTEKSTHQWLDGLVSELRIHSATGPAIGDAVAEVEAHLAETGEHPQEAFGTPRQYAATLTLPTDAAQQLSPRLLTKLILGAAAGFTGALWLVPYGLAAVKRHEAAVLPMGMVISLAALILFSVLISLTINRFSRSGLYAGVVLFAMAAVIGASVGVFLFQPLFTMNQWLAAASGVILALVSVPLMPSFGPETEITDPRGRQSRYGGGRATTSALAWMWPIIAVVAGAIAWLMS